MKNTNFICFISEFDWISILYFVYSILYSDMSGADIFFYSEIGPEVAIWSTLHRTPNMPGSAS